MYWLMSYLSLIFHSGSGIRYQCNMMSRTAKSVIPPPAFSPREAPWCDPATLWWALLEIVKHSKAGKWMFKRMVNMMKYKPAENNEIHLYVSIWIDLITYWVKKKKITMAAYHFCALLKLHYIQTTILPFIMHSQMSPYIIK